MVNVEQSKVDRTVADLTRWVESHEPNAVENTPDEQEHLLVDFDEALPKIADRITRLLGHQEQVVVNVVGLPDSGKTEFINRLMLNHLDAVTREVYFVKSLKKEEYAFQYEDGRIVMCETGVRYVPGALAFEQEHHAGPEWAKPDMTIVMYNPQFDTVTASERDTILREVDVVITNTKSNRKYSYYT